MRNFPKPTLVISKCLGETPCRYNGEAATCGTLLKLKDFVNLIEVCPEEGIGLPTPRNSIRLINNNNNIVLIDPKTLKDYTNNMVEFADEFINCYKDLNPEGFLLKSKSPSCGLNDAKIYSTNKNGASSIKGKGLFTSKIYYKFSDIPIEDDGRISNFLIRENFLTRIFLLASFKECLTLNNMNSLINFHSENKLLFMSYSQLSLKKLGKIVANHEKNNISDVLNNYYQELLKITSKSPRKTSLINTFNHALGYFTENLDKKEINYFYENIEMYRNSKIPNSVLKALLKGYAIRFNNEYLLSQSFLEPYPEDLIDICDSGKGRS